MVYCQFWYWVAIGLLVWFMVSVPGVAICNHLMHDRMHIGTSEGSRKVEFWFRLTIVNIVGISVGLVGAFFVLIRLKGTDCEFVPPEYLSLVIC